MASTLSLLAPWDQTGDWVAVDVCAAAQARTGILIEMLREAKNAPFDGMDKIE
jgi:hypothetical protein